MKSFLKNLVKVVVLVSSTATVLAMTAPLGTGLFGLAYALGLSWCLWHVEA